MDMVSSFQVLPADRSPHSFLALEPLRKKNNPVCLSYSVGLPWKPHPPVRCSVITFQHCMEGLKTQHPLLWGSWASQSLCRWAAVKASGSLKLGGREREVTAEILSCPVLCKNPLLALPVNIDQEVLQFGVRHILLSREPVPWQHVEKKACWHQNITHHSTMG